MNQEHSRQLFDEACNYLPGGVDSPVRAYTAVGGIPAFIVKGEGSKIYDADGNKYIDYVCSWGPLILGHAYPSVVKALKTAISRGTSFGAPTELEIKLAKVIYGAMTSIEMVRFVNSGTEAVMTALRLARAFTGRNKILKFSGCYHGHADSLLVKAGSGLATLGIPYSAGVPSGCVEDTLVAQFNNIEQVNEIFRMQGETIAGVIVEPVAANMGVVLPVPGFLEKLREITERYSSLLIFDEVITGFRVDYGGAQTRFGIKPDLTCLGKIIGGGLPVGAFGGRRDIMQMLAPLGPVYQAGTLSGNPLAMTAGLETLAVLGQPGTHDRLEANSGKLTKGISEAAAKHEIKVVVSRCGSLLTVFFTDKQVTDYESASLSDTSRFAAFFQRLLAQGIYWPPSQFEAAFISLVHSDDDIRRTIKCYDIAFKKLAAG